MDTVFDSTCTDREDTRETAVHVWSLATSERQIIALSKGSLNRKATKQQKTSAVIEFFVFSPTGCWSVLETADYYGQQSLPYCQLCTVASNGKCLDTGSGVTEVKIGGVNIFTSPFLCSKPCSSSDVYLRPLWLLYKTLSSIPLDNERSCCRSFYWCKIKISKTVKERVWLCENATVSVLSTCDAPTRHFKDKPTCPHSLNQKCQQKDHCSGKKPESSGWDFGAWNPNSASYSSIIWISVYPVIIS